MKPDLAFMLDNASWPALLVDGASSIRRANQAAVRIFGLQMDGSAPELVSIWPQENGQTPVQFLANWERSPGSPAPVKLRVKGGNAAPFVASICSWSHDGQKYFVLQMLPQTSAGALGRPAVPDGGQALKQKLDCALHLARTVALDFNNALTSILGHTSLVLSQVPADHPWRASLQEVEKSAGRAAEIAEDLGTFSRQEKESRAQTAGNLNSVLQRTVDVFRQHPGATPITWSLQLERKLFAAKFDEAKMQQAFAKILENAIQALKTEGQICIQSKNLELKEPTQDRNARLAAGSYVCVEITDDGSGIAPEVLPRIFEPFFTTKGEAHRGLGLAWVYGIVTNHGGGVAVSSQPGAGTSVRVYLPAEKRIVKDDSGSADDLRGSETVLMVDDEDLLLTLGRTILGAYGYKVLTANNGQRALELLSGEARVDLLITDLVMPGMTGRELIERVQHQAPGMPILCTSGYVWPAGQQTEQGYLQKPFTARELLSRVRAALHVGGDNE